MIMSSPGSESCMPPNTSSRFELGNTGFIKQSYNTPSVPSFISQPISPITESMGHLTVKSLPSCRGPALSADLLASKSSKRKSFNGDLLVGRDTCTERMEEPQRKLHLTEDYVAQTMSELHISHPKSKVARRSNVKDVNEAMNLDVLNDLEVKFSNHAIQEDLSLPPIRNRKVAARNKNPQLRLTIHQDLKSVRSANSIPDSLLARYRPSPRQGSTALVLWKPPGGIIPDVITSTWKSNKGRTRCLSEMTYTPYSSHENLIDPDNCEMAGSMDSRPMQNSAEAPELSSPTQDEECPHPSFGLQRRNSAPEISEPLPFIDDGSMEL